MAIVRSVDLVNNLDWIPSLSPTIQHQFRAGCRAHLDGGAAPHLTGSHRGSAGCGLTLLCPSRLTWSSDTRTTPRTTDSRFGEKGLLQQRGSLFHVSARSVDRCVIGPSSGRIERRLHHCGLLWVLGEIGDRCGTLGDYPPGVFALKGEGIVGSLSTRTRQSSPGTSQSNRGAARGRTPGRRPQFLPAFDHGLQGDALEAYPPSWPGLRGSQERAAFARP